MQRFQRQAWLAFNIANAVQGRLFTSVITVIAGNSATTTPCSELDPIENREQWAQQCAMARTNIGPNQNHRITTTRNSRETSRFGDPRVTETTVESRESTLRISTTRTQRLSWTTTIAASTRTTISDPRTLTTLSTSPTTQTPSASPSSPPASEQSSSSAPNVGVILGAIFGVLALVALVAHLFYRKNDSCRSFFKSRIGRHRSTRTHRNMLQDSSHYVPEMSAPGFRGGRGTRGGLSSPMTGEGSVLSEREGSPGMPMARSMEGGRRSYMVANPDPPSARSAASGTIDIGYNGREQVGSPQSWTHTDGGYGGDDEQRELDDGVMSPASARSPGSGNLERPHSGINVLSQTNASHSGSEGSFIDELGPRPSPSGPPPQAYTPYAPASGFGSFSRA